MSSKSRKYSIAGSNPAGAKFVFFFNEKGQIEGVKKQKELGKPLRSINPNSPEFEKVTSSSQALNHIMFTIIKGRKKIINNQLMI